MTREDSAREDLGSEQRIEQELEARFVPLVEERGFELVETTYRREQRGWVLRFTVERVGGGLTVDEGVRLSREFGALIEADPHLDRLLAGPYHLEVSSPGIFRELKRPRDFERAWGKRVRVQWTATDGRSREAVGRLDAYGDGVLRLQDASPDEETEIGIDSLQKVRLDPELPF